MRWGCRVSPGRCTLGPSPAPQQVGGWDILPGHHLRPLSFQPPALPRDRGANQESRQSPLSPEGLLPPGAGWAGAHTQPKAPRALSPGGPGGPTSPLSPFGPEGPWCPGGTETPVPVTNDVTEAPGTGPPAHAWPDPGGHCEHCRPGPGRGQRVNPGTVRAGARDPRKCPVVAPQGLLPEATPLLQGGARTNSRLGRPVGGRSVFTPIHSWPAWKAVLGGPRSPAKGAVINRGWGAWIIQHPREGRPHPALSCGWKGDLPSPRPQDPHLAVPGVQGGQTPQTPAKNRPKMAVEGDALETEATTHPRVCKATPPSTPVPQDRAAGRGRERAQDLESGAPVTT